MAVGPDASIRSIASSTKYRKKDKIRILACRYHYQMGVMLQTPIAPSSADLGFADADERQTKARLALAINRILEKRRLSQTQAAQRLGIDQPKISALANYRLEGFSVERPMHFLNALWRDVEIIIRNKPASRRKARIIVTAVIGNQRDSPLQKS
jgi:predicted XRE-type DNA-binding protein